MMRTIDFRRRRPILFAFLILLTLLGTTASAHFLLNLNVRILHVAHVQDGLKVFIRIPMPYLVADKLGAAANGELPAPAPYTRNANENGALVHFVDFEKMAEDPLGLGQLVENGFSFANNDIDLPGEVRGVQLYRIGNEPGFATLAEAEAAMATDQIVNTSSPQFVGDTVVDVELFVPTPGSLGTYSISSSLDPGLPGQEETANLILDYGPGNPKVYRSRGLMREPVVITRSTSAAVVTFVWEGIRHILEGLDHVLFVICIVLGAQTLSALLWRVTGFTIGHSVTLAIGFFGFVPTAAWFVPLVETGIALSIIYAAVLAFRPTSNGQSSLQMFVVTVFIGLLHGLGFSFVLQKILQVTSPNIWESLLAFNLGVELGQLAIVLAVWPLMLWLKSSNARMWGVVRVCLAVGCLLIATFWTVERVGQVAVSI